MDDLTEVREKTAFTREEGRQPLGWTDGGESESVKRFWRLLTVKSSEPMWVIEASMEQRRNERVGETGNLEKTCRPAALSVVRLLASQQGEPGLLRSFVSGNRARRCHWSMDFLGDLSFPPPFLFGSAPYLPYLTLIGSQYLAQPGAAARIIVLCASSEFISMRCTRSLQVFTSTSVKTMILLGRGDGDTALLTLYCTNLLLNKCVQHSGTPCVLLQWNWACGMANCLTGQDFALRQKHPPPPLPLWRLSAGCTQSGTAGAGHRAMSKPQVIWCLCTVLIVVVLFTASVWAVWFSGHCDITAGRSACTVLYGGEVASCLYHCGMPAVALPRCFTPLLMVDTTRDHPDAADSVTRGPRV
ncbi:hypothetical protein PR048_023526 [Dryococelus australis]|uniref:Uncharacterized protein n=1 Tax=Dryococelus australis TaxID=614101 RepID=A0ABQ9GUC1_9NEOP|nr:hypothetical protein PR048_023526 [Dryococelus australis]